MRQGVADVLDRVRLDVKLESEERLKRGRRVADASSDARPDLALEDVGQRGLEPGPASRGAALVLGSDLLPGEVVVVLAKAVVAAVVVDGRTVLVVVLSGAEQLQHGDHLVVETVQQEGQKLLGIFLAAFDHLRQKKKLCFKLSIE